MIGCLAGWAIDRAAGGPRVAGRDGPPDVWSCAGNSQTGAPAAASIAPGSRCENPYIESFGGRPRDECLDCEVFPNLQEARVVIEA